MLLIAFFRGTRTVRVLPCERQAVFSCLLDNSIRAVRSIRGADGTIELTFYTQDFKRLQALLEQKGCSMPRTISRRGLPVVLQLWKRRPGIPVGAALALLLLSLSASVVWRVDVTCADNADDARAEDIVDTEAVLSRLREQGVAEGLFLPTFDSRHAERTFLIGQDIISWMAINRQGTVLSVEVRPSRAVREDHTGKPLPTEDGKLAGGNLVANGDGQIVRTELRNGVSLVVPEQMVTRGDVLATGIFESKDGDVRYTRVTGKVFAKTLRILTVTIPLTVEEISYSGETATSRTLYMFGHAISLPSRHAKGKTNRGRQENDAESNVTFLEIFQNFFGNSGFSAAEYDIIEDNKFLRLPDGTALPVFLHTETKNGMITTKRTLTEEEAVQRAEAQLSEMRDALTDAEILSCEAVVSRTEDAITVTWNIDCIDNIAEGAEFLIAEDP